MPLAAWGAGTSITAHNKTNAECYFHFLPFFIKGKILFGISFGKQKQVVMQVFS